MGAKIDIEVAVGRISGQVQLAHADDICDGLGFEKVNFDQWSKEMQAATFGEQSLIVASMYRLLGENEVDGIGAAYLVMGVDMDGRQKAWIQIGEETPAILRDRSGVALALADSPARGIGVGAVENQLVINCDDKMKIFMDLSLRTFEVLFGAEDGG